MGIEDSVIHPLLFLRHGETQWNVEGRYQGATDTELSEKGCQQAASHGSLVEKLCREGCLNGPDLTLVSSPLKRAVETAEILCANLAPLAVPGIKIDTDLRELSFGRWEGMTSMEVKAKFYHERKSRKSDRFAFAPEGGDSMASRENAVGKSLKTLPHNAIVVTHSALLRLIAHILGRNDALTLPVPHEGGFLWDGKNFSAV